MVPSLASSNPVWASVESCRRGVRHRRAIFSTSRMPLDQSAHGDSLPYILPRQPTETFDPVGFCIYCGTRAPPLTKEHIVPFGLAGNLVLPKASCKSCAAVTAAFEDTCLRRMFWSIRIQLGLPTRRPKERPECVPVDILDKNNQVIRTLDVDPAAIPPAVFFPLLPLPDLLLQRPRMVQPTIDVWLVSYGEEAVIEFKKKIGAEKIRLGGLDILAFMRMIAKIGYCYAVKEFSKIGFKPIIISSIMNNYPKIGSFVGSKSREPPPIEHDFIHRLSAYVDMIDDEPHIIVRVRLFAFLGAPEYHVIVGRITSTPKPPL
jgi:hypothetical protein